MFVQQKPKLIEKMNTNNQFFFVIYLFTEKLSKKRTKEQPLFECVDRSRGTQPKHAQWA
jgi:hypothetical protein